MPAKKVFGAVRNPRVVRVGGGTKPELVRVVALRVLHRDSVLERLPRVAADDVRNAAIRVAEQERPDLVASELVVGRKQRMRLRSALDLLYLDQPLVAH